MAEIIDDIKEITNVTRKYLDVKIEMIRAKATIAISEVISTMVIAIIVAVLLGGGLLIISFGLAESLGHKLDDRALGFYIVGAGYLIVCAIMFLIGKTFLKRYIQNEIIRKLEEKHE
jgi:hypothetical protein